MRRTRNPLLWVAPFHEACGRGGQKGGSSSGAAVSGGKIGFPWWRLRWLTLVTALGSILLAGAAHAESPVDRTHKLIETFKTVKAPPEGGDGKLSPADQAANAKVFTALDGFFDFPTFTVDCLGPAAGKLSAAQAKEAKERLVHILRRRGYSNGGSVFNEGVIQMGKPVDRGGGTAVPLKVSFPKQDISMDVEFVWNKAGKIIDLVLDGDSLSKDTRNQIGRIVAKNGAADLLRRLTEKQRDADK
jgi:ABC-type transporter MlaC component